MPQRCWFRMLLAHKISLLFGTAVFLVIVVTLWSPWLQMTALYNQAMLLKAKHVAAAAYLAVDLNQPDWNLAQRELANAWPALAGDLDLPANPPILVPEDRQLPPRGFRTEAWAHLSDDPERPYYWKTQDDERVFRFAMAVRRAEADPHPDALRGFIDVKLQRAGGEWYVDIRRHRARRGEWRGAGDPAVLRGHAATCPVARVGAACGSGTCRVRRHRGALRH